MQLKMADFGLAKGQPKRRGTMKASTPKYWALEVVMEEEHTDRIDTFSLGIISCNMLTEVTPRITTKKPKNLLLVLLSLMSTSGSICPTLWRTSFHRHGFKAVPDTAFDMVRVFDNSSVEKHARALENNGETPGA
ncbi:hypothetical protein KI688_006407 [Linnemannia hyalina]|uniref:Protein kinase domain-containing protein n=1 Tax=Linnemannia hyalina TaxID=64524 RepID=A0A9P7Y4K1_9FUNG|nr:hypothetical protein KI688_006407 [Linnemannia hyalina]